MREPINFDDLAELDRQYDIRQAVPDIMEIADLMAQQSERTRSEHFGYGEFSYGDSPLQKLDYFPAYPNSPLLIYIHGGYWHAFDKSVFSNVGAAWNRVGVSVAVINYRLAPAVAMREIVDDVRQSIIWLWRNAVRLGFDKSRMIACGSSAGGHLTAMMLATDWTTIGKELPLNLLKGGASISGLHDLGPFLRAPFLKDKVRLTEQDVEEFSPARRKPATSAPIITCVGGDESPAFHAQNRLIAECWPEAFKADIPSSGTNHVTVNNELTNTESQLFKAVQELLAG